MEDDKKRLFEYGLKDGDIIVIEHRRRGKRKTAAKARAEVDVRRGFSLLHHDTTCTFAVPTLCPICAGPSPLAPNLTVRPLSKPSKASGTLPERSDIKF